MTQQKFVKASPRMIEKKKESLRKTLVNEWQEDGCTPPNYVITNGLDEVIAKVDRWCGDYQDPHAPIVIGWVAKNGNAVISDMIIVNQPNLCPGCGKHATNLADSTIKEAKQEAVLALKKLGINWKEDK